MVRKVNYINFFNRIILILTIIMFASLIIFEQYAWGKYIFLGLSILIFVIDNLIHRGSKIRFGQFQIMFGLFILYCFMTSIWALKPSNALSFSRTLIFIYICLFFLEPHFARGTNTPKFLYAIIWASVIVAVYTIIFYGLDNLILSSKSYDIRLENEFSNINTIGIFCALGVVLQFERWVYNKKFEASIPFVFISFFVAASTQSRKAILLIVLSFVIIVILKNHDKKKIANSATKTIASLLVLIIIIYIIFKLEIFSGLNQRLEQLFYFVSGSGDADSGSLKRKYMFDLGMETWKKYPILGIGLNCTRIIVMNTIGMDSYLHNNYVELLCATGIIGFFLYYNMYIYLIINLIKNRNKNKRYFILGCTLLAISLMLDFGMVSYYSKFWTLLLMFQFINVYNLKYNYY